MASDFRRFWKWRRRRSPICFILVFVSFLHPYLRLASSSGLLTSRTHPPPSPRRPRPSWAHSWPLRKLSSRRKHACLRLPTDGTHGRVTVMSASRPDGTSFISMRSGESWSQHHQQHPHSRSGWSRLAGYVELNHASEEGHSRGHSHSHSHGPISVPIHPLPQAETAAHAHVYLLSSRSESAPLVRPGLRGTKGASATDRLKEAYYGADGEGENTVVLWDSALETVTGSERLVLRQEEEPPEEEPANESPPVESEDMMTRVITFCRTLLLFRWGDKETTVTASAEERDEQLASVDGKTEDDVSDAGWPPQNATEPDSGGPAAIDDQDAELGEGAANDTMAAEKQDEMPSEEPPPIPESSDTQPVIPDGLNVTQQDEGASQEKPATQQPQEEKPTQPTEQPEAEQDPLTQAAKRFQAFLRDLFEEPEYNPIPLPPTPPPRRRRDDKSAPSQPQDQQQQEAPAAEKEGELVESEEVAISNAIMDSCLELGESVRNGTFDNAEWELLHSADICTLWRRPVPGTSLYEYLARGRFDDISVSIYNQTINDLDFRQTWDGNIAGLKVIDQTPVYHVQYGTPDAVSGFASSEAQTNDTDHHSELRIVEHHRLRGNNASDTAVSPSHPAKPPSAFQSPPKMSNGQLGRNNGGDSEGAAERGNGSAGQGDLERGSDSGRDASGSATVGNGGLKLPNDLEEVVYWRFKLPWPLQDRDFVFARRFRLYYGRGAFVSVQQAVEHPEVPEYTDTMRIREYRSRLVLFAANQEAKVDRPGMEYVLMHFDDPRSNLPPWVTTYLTANALPSTMQTLHETARQLVTNTAANKISPAANATGDAATADADEAAATPPPETSDTSSSNQTSTLETTSAPEQQQEEKGGHTNKTASEEPRPEAAPPTNVTSEGGEGDSEKKEDSSGKDGNPFQSFWSNLLKGQQQKTKANGHDKGKNDLRGQEGEKEGKKEDDAKREDEELPATLPSRRARPFLPPNP
ncbi:unnamed protein product [Vitrella brassicaformis CCMP3155]|uniref:START domain-containing protein n=3 Tax=Vitrella brassicaformis TaxID=1169539 RepID=A0A0G4EF16_VITBC|nr:unnamed protein product [Vitrella brassicaformis CCMP3155]|eukprot:CEL94114.1 unnamed protein product [Vitrella brassicaformis CCMP3155]